MNSLFLMFFFFVERTLLFLGSVCSVERTSSNLLKQWISDNPTGALRTCGLIEFGGVSHCLPVCDGVEKSLWLDF